jgi:hypothetical protein
MANRPKIEPIRQPSLFETGSLEEAADLGKLEAERPYSDPNLLLGTSAFTANGWSGTFYPAGMKPTDYLSFYATKFKTVEIDSTYYGPPSASTVMGWRDKTPSDFIFAAKAPQTITHEKVLVDCDPDSSNLLKPWTSWVRSWGHWCFSSHISNAGSFRSKKSSSLC